MEIFNKIKSLISKFKPQTTDSYEFKKTKKIVIIILSIIFLIIIFFVVKKIFLKPKVVVKDTPAIKVKVEKLVRGDYSQKYTVMGSIKGAIENDLRFEIEGVLAKYNYKEGKKLFKGDVIAYLDPKDAMTKLSYAKSKFESERSAYYSAQQRLKVYEDLFKLKSISESKLIESRYEVESIRQRMETAQAELQLAQSNLTKTNLVAPSEGVLAQIIVQPGEFITPNDVVARFVSSGDANFEVDVPEKDVNQLKYGLNSKVYCDSYPDKIFEGQVSEIAPTVKEKTRTVTVKIRLPNEEGLLRSGMFARGEILVIESSNTIAVNSDSVISLGGDVRLLPILKPLSDKQGQGMIEFRQVKVGGNIGKSVVVLDGVVEGEFYVTETSGELSDGLVVEYTETFSGQIMSR